MTDEEKKNMPLENFWAIMPGAIHDKRDVEINLDLEYINFKTPGTYMIMFDEDTVTIEKIDKTA